MSDNKPTAEDLAKKGKVKRLSKAEKKAIMQQKSAEKNEVYRRVLDQKRVFLHISRWYGWRLFFVWMSVMCLATILPFLLVVAMNSDARPFYEGFVMFFVVPFVILVALTYIAKFMARKKALQEKEWIEAQPFELKGFPDFLVYRSYPSFYITVEFERKVPDQEYFMDIIANLPYDKDHELKTGKNRPDPDFDFDELEIEEVQTLKSIMEDKASDSEDENPNRFKFEVNNPAGSKFNRHRRWAYRWIHQACDTHFKAIHEQFPIKSVTIGEGTVELDFNWWIPMRQRGFLFMQ